VFSQGTKYDKNMTPAHGLCSLLEASNVGNVLTSYSFFFLQEQEKEKIKKKKRKRRRNRKVKLKLPISHIRSLRKPQDLTRP
jgi:hypothetical protein